jgi:hypothetical protein
VKFTGIPDLGAHDHGAPTGPADTEGPGDEA